MGVRYRKDRGKWLCDAVVKGKRASKMFDTQADACEYEASLKKPEADIKGEANSFKLAVKKYYDTVSTYKRSAKKEKHFFTHLFKFLQARRVSQLEKVNFEMLHDFQAEVLGRGVSKSTSNRYFTTFKHFFKLCVQWGLIDRSPAEKIQMFSENKNKITRKLWSDEQVVEAISKPEGWLKDFLVVVAHTGMRPIEVCRLTWSEHVDLSKGLVKAVSYKGVGREMDRLLPMSSDLKLMLMRRKLATGSKFVFPNRIRTCDIHLVRVARSKTITN
jgi:integrase